MSSSSAECLYVLTLSCHQICNGTCMWSAGAALCLTWHAGAISVAHSELTQCSANAASWALLQVRCHTRHGEIVICCCKAAMQRRLTHLAHGCCAAAGRLVHTATPTRTAAGTRAQCPCSELHHSDRVAVHESPPSTRVLAIAKRTICCYAPGNGSRRPLRINRALCQPLIRPFGPLLLLLQIHKRLLIRKLGIPARV